MITDFSRYTFAFIAALLLLVSCSGEHEMASQEYYTWDGLEPDKWGSVWLMKRHLDPDSKVTVVPVGASVRGAIAIDTPDAKYKRTHGLSVFELMLASSEKGVDPALVKIGSILNELEVSAWSSSSQLADLVEAQFRALQFEYNRINVPVECYAGFFDQLYDTLSQASEVDLESLHAQLDPKKVCTTQPEVIADRNHAPVLEYSIDSILKMIDTDKKVVFVDTREDAEYDGSHIPGSITIRLRDVNDSVTKQFEDADLVISYCVKDFRGYEVALALSRAGVKKSGIMKPYGIKGWKKEGLPVVNEKVSEAEALEKLKACAAEGNCKYQEKKI